MGTQIALYHYIFKIIYFVTIYYVGPTQCEEIMGI
jgi:hypothetical protein